ncbi:probable multidrug resistance-associated protein lethal(2)03659 [Photinus pyralis]|uniref:probable multidrug resistance-associated protein lethal(2)03659 n=1 Tax=Photinus pyralis TaxID=7054 RepID=UPI0012675D72|nr:probable multidrug resistance-associated protein lethal(2)03659 [Photinus pyralis]
MRRGDDDTRLENPRARANWLSVATFWYTFKIFRMGARAELVEDDLMKPLKSHEAGMLGEKYSRTWTAELNRAEIEHDSPSLSKVIRTRIFAEFVLYGCWLFFMEVVIRLYQPIFIGLLVRYFDPTNDLNTLPRKEPLYFNRAVFFTQKNQCAISKEEAYFYGSSVFLISTIVTAILHPNLTAMMHLGMKIRVGCCSLIYRKVLRIRLTALGDKVVGRAINLMSNDVMRFDMAPLFWHYVWISPLQALIITYYMYQELKTSAFIGMLAMAAIMPFQAWLGRQISNTRYTTAFRTDNRVRQMNEIIRGMQVIKMYAWENPFLKKISISRQHEINSLRITSYIKGVIMSFIMFTARFALFLSITSYVYNGNELSSETVYVVAAYYEILRQTMTVYFPQGVAQIAEASVAINRIREFLLSPEADVGDKTPMDPDSKKRGAKSTTKTDISLMARRMGLPMGIVIEGAWAKYEDEVCLKNIDLVVVPGQLTALVGQVGAGKSCMLQLILGELPPFVGTAEMYGTVSYASQEPWLFAGSVRQNILFGQPYDRSRYREVVKVCALARDFTLLPYGDKTIVGERGASLSGGQRARVNLARAVYKQADIYLLDDPLSAVDTHVGQHLFDYCISQYLGSKAVVLVTHQLQYLKQVPQIVIMHEGEILIKGSYSFLQSSGLQFSNIIGEDTESVARSNTAPTNQLQDILRNISITSSMGVNVQAGGDNEPQEELEIRSYGAIDCKLFYQYFRAGAHCCVLLLLLLFFCGAQFCGSSTDFYLSDWIKQHGQRNSTIANDNRTSIKDFITTYSIYIGTTALLALSRSFFFFTVCMRASVNLHNRMFNSVVRSTMRFFNANPSGRILNRFSKDLGAIDELLPNAMIDTVQIFLNLVGASAVIGVIDPILLAPALVISICFLLLRRYYLKTSRSIKRLEGITTSPVFCHLNGTLQGLTTIRTHGQEVLLTSEFDKLLDLHSGAWYLFLCTSRAFSYWIDCLCCVFIGAIVFMFFAKQNKPYSSEVGISITQCLGLTGLLQWGMRQSAELENQMTAVERVLEFTKIEQEPPLESNPDYKPSITWPSKGRITFRNAYMRYSPTEPPVLKNLNFVIEPKEKIGIVGRTGAGKSSLIGALFRLAYFEGEIIIDNVDIGRLGLHDLRKKISIIPQEPILFSGTIRYNLDPFEEYPDTSLLAVLQVIEIKSALQDGVACLDLMVSEGGSNISVGYRQLICLARALLRNNKILVLDEATANVDAQTDKFIQTTIRTKFDNCTVLTIAHRLHTIMDSDKVLVMDAGELVEMDHPHNLFKNKNGNFSGMVRRMGPLLEEQLKNIAKLDYEKKFGATAAPPTPSPTPKKK